MFLLRAPLLLATLCASSVPALAQLPPHQFSLRLGYSATVILSDITTDNDGNIYAVGYFNSSVDLDPGPGENLHTSAGSYDIFLVKINANGEHQWGRTYGSPSDDRCNAIAFDPLSQAIIIGGTTVNGIDFDGIEVFSSGLSDAYLYKLGTDGTPIWANDGNSDSNPAESLTDLVVGSDGSIYYTGAWASNASATSQVALVKMTSGGAVVDDHLYGGVNMDYGTHITLAPDGAVHLLGKFRYRDVSPYNVTFGSFTFTSGSTLDYGENIMYLKIEAGSGTVLDAKVVAHNADQETPTGLVVDPAGVVYIAGVYGSSFNGNASLFGIQVTEPPSSYTNGFVVKLHPNGASDSWARVFPNGSSWSVIRGLGVDANGIVHAFGEASPGIDIDPTSNSVFTTPAGNFNFLTRLNNDGSFHDAYLYNNIITSRVLLQSNGALILAGNYANNNDFDPGPGVVSLPSAGGGVPDAFVSKLFDITTNVATVASTGIRITPNPANVYITINGTAPQAPYAVFDMLGQQVLSGRSMGPGHAVDVSALNAGTYLLRTEASDGAVLSGRFVVAKP